MDSSVIRYFDEKFGDYAWSLCVWSSGGLTFSSRFRWTSLMSSIQLQYSACVKAGGAAQAAQALA